MGGTEPNSRENRFVGRLGEVTYASKAPVAILLEKACRRQDET